jgi:hypothetical protein
MVWGSANFSELNFILTSKQISIDTNVIWRNGMNTLQNTKKLDLTVVFTLRVFLSQLIVRDD